MIPPYPPSCPHLGLDGAKVSCLLEVPEVEDGTHEEAESLWPRHGLSVGHQGGEAAVPRPRGHTLLEKN